MTKNNDSYQSSRTNNIDIDFSKARGIKTKIHNLYSIFH